MKLSIKFKYFMAILVLLFLILSINLSAQPHSPKKLKIGLALSGGGAKGIAHIPVLETLDSMGIQIDVITGTSIGSIVGALYAVGYSGRQIRNIVFQMDWDKILSDKIDRKKQAIYMKAVSENIPFILEWENNHFRLPSGLVNGYQLMKFLNRYFYRFTHIHQFDSLPIPFHCVATNIETGSKKIFTSGNLIDAIRASISIPSYFVPWEIDDSLYVDGGLVANNPVEEAFKMGADIVLAVDISAPLKSREQLTDAISILDQSTSLNMVKLSRKALSKANFVIRPHISTFGVLDFHLAKSIYDSGVVAVRKNMWIFDSLKILSEDKPKSIKKTATLPDLNQKLNVQFLKFDGPSEFEKEIFLGMQLDNSRQQTIKELENSLDRLYGSGKYKQLYMYLEPLGGKIFLLHVKAVPYTSSLAAFTFNYSNYLNLQLGAVFLKPVFLKPSLSLSTSLLLGEEKTFHASLFSSFFRNTKFVSGVEIFGSNKERPITLNNHPVATFDEKRLLIQIFARRIIGNAALLQVNTGIEQFYAVPQIGNIQINRNSDKFWRSGALVFIDMKPDYFSPSTGYSLFVSYLIRKSMNKKDMFQKFQIDWQVFGPKIESVLFFHQAGFGTTLSSPLSYINQFYLGTPYDFSGSKLYYQNLNHYLYLKTGIRLPEIHHFIPEPAIEMLFSSSELGRSVFDNPTPGMSISLRRKFMVGILNLKGSVSKNDKFRVWLSFGYDLRFFDFLMP